MHETLSIATDVFSLSVRLSVTRLNSASLCKKTAERIKVLYGVNIFEAN